MSKMNATQTRAARCVVLRTLMGGSPDPAPGPGLSARILCEIAMGVREPTKDMVEMIKEEAEGREQRWRKLMRLPEDA